MRKHRRLATALLAAGCGALWALTVIAPLAWGASAEADSDIRALAITGTTVAAVAYIIAAVLRPFLQQLADARGRLDAYDASLSAITEAKERRLAPVAAPRPRLSVASTGRHAG